MASDGGKAKIKYAKLRLFKPSGTGSKGEQETRHDEGQNPKIPSSESINKMEQEVIYLSDSEDAELLNQKTRDEPLLKRTRLNEHEKLEKSKLPKFPKNPPESGGIISNFFKTSEDDFELKKDVPPKAKTNAQRKTTTTRKPRAPRKPRNQSDIRKVFQKYKDNDDELLKNLMLEHTLTDRLDPEQFQVALAMSRSLVDQGGSQTDSSERFEQQQEEPKASSSENSFTSDERRIQRIRTTLEQYGFKCKNSYTDYDLNVIFGNATRNVKKIKHQRPTMLIRRDPEDVIGFMERQAKRLLEDDLYKPYHEWEGVDLHQRSYGSTVFWMSQNPAQSTEIISDYYVEALVDISLAKAGNLLKNWSMIPGRQRTPERRTAEMDNEKQEDTFASVERCDEGEELIEDPEDSKLDMNTVSDDYRRLYNNEVPIHVRTVAKMDSSETRRSASPELFASDSGGEEDCRTVQSAEEIVEVHETPSEQCEEEVDFLTAQEEMVNDDAQLDTRTTEGIVRATSSENIFEDSDPIINYEVYSSEEAKMSSSLPEEKEPSNQPDFEFQQSSVTEDPQTAVLSLSSSESNHDDCHQNTTTAVKRISSDKTDSGINQKERRFDNQLFPSPAKEYSFHALAIKDKLNRISQIAVETIELDNECDEPKKAKSEPEENHSLDGMDGPSSDVDYDGLEDVLIISDDEVNYSIQQNNSITFNVNCPSALPVIFGENVFGEPGPLDNPLKASSDNIESDLENTKVYFNVEDFRRLSSETNVPNKDSESKSTDGPNMSLQADNTMAFLDGIVKKYNLPPSLSRQSTCDEANEIGLEDYIQNYDIPDFPDNQLEQTEEENVQLVANKNPAPVSSEQLDLEIEQILSQAKQTCTQFQQQESHSIPIRRTTSDSVLIGNSEKTSTVTSPNVKRKDCFDGKFKELARDPAPSAVGIEIRLDGISPRPDYEQMESPLLHRELFKYGLKQLSRPKAVKILNHIYNQLHPTVEIVQIEESDTIGLECGNTKESDRVGPLRNQKSFVPEMEDEQFILPSKPRKKTFWCAVPLHIAFHNMVNANPRLRRQMLLYQPIDLDEVYNHLKDIGLRYESNDLIAFLDKRCITFRTSQGSGSRTKKGTANQDAPVI